MTITLSQKKWMKRHSCLMPMGKEQALAQLTVASLVIILVVLGKAENVKHNSFAHERVMVVSH